MRLVQARNSFVPVSNETVPKQHSDFVVTTAPFVPVSNETVPKRNVASDCDILPFVPVSNETVPKPRYSLFRFQQLTINTSSPIVVI